MKEAIIIYEDYLRLNKLEGLRTLLCSLILIKVVLDEKQLKCEKLLKFTSKHLINIAAGANDWGKLKQETLDEIRENVSLVSNGYILDKNTPFREFIKNIGASGISDPLGPEGRGDLAFGLMLFNELALRFEFETYEKVSDEFIQIIINHLDCEGIIQDLNEAVQGLVDKIQDHYAQ